MVSLTQILAMREDKVMAAAWLSENVDLVLADLDHLHNLQQTVDLAHSCLDEAISGKTWRRLWVKPELVEKAKEILDNAS